MIDGARTFDASKVNAQDVVRAPSLAATATTLTEPLAGYGR
jgi:hypothetical protein